jgi:molybdopterin synthase sulfur carrier subunit
VEVEVRIPAMLRKLTGGDAAVTAEGDTVGEVIDFLDGRYAGIRAELIADDGQIHRFVNIYLNDEDIRFIEKLETVITEGDTLSILPAVAGGCR